MIAVAAIAGVAGGGYAVAQAAAKPIAAPVIGSTPADPTNATSATFTFTDPRAGVTFECALDTATFATCTSPRTYAGPLADGPHAFTVRSRSASGVSLPASYPWTIDRTPPSAPTLTSWPDNPTDATTATFAFTDAEKSATFRCRLDGAAAQACASKQSYTGLSTGPHTFTVTAVDTAGNVSAPTSYAWTVDPAAVDVLLAGDVTQPLYPGAASPVDVRISNPFSFDVYVSGVTVTPRAATTKNGQPNPACDGTVNLRVAHQYLGAAVNVPPKSTVSLSGTGVARSLWPTLQMPDLAVNQDACKGTTFSFSYSATATKK
jgi:hypothetical protein